MKNIIYKELNLVMNPAIYLFPFLSALLLIPHYPYSVGVSYVLLGLFITFNIALANNDHLFTAMLPVPRNYIVAGKVFTVMFTEVLQLVVALPFALLSLFVINTGGNSVGLDANMTFFGVTLIEYSLFNLIFIPWYFKTGYKTGMPMLMAVTAYAVAVAVFETLISLIPVLHYALDGVSIATAGYRAAVLAAGIILYFGAILVSYKLGAKNFRKVNL